MAPIPGRNPGSVGILKRGDILTFMKSRPWPWNDFVLACGIEDDNTPTPRIVHRVLAWEPDNLDSDSSVWATPRNHLIITALKIKTNLLGLVAMESTFEVWLWRCLVSLVWQE